VALQPNHDLCASDACKVPPNGAPLPPIDTSSWRVTRRRAVWRAAAGRVADRDSSRRVTALLVDVGGVVIPTLFESVRIEGFPGGPFADDPEWRRVQHGETTERDYWAAVADRRPDIDVPALWQACSYVRSELRHALEALYSRVRLVAFTNDMVHFFGERWPERFPEMRAFDAIVEANKLGINKPEPEAFRAAADTIGEAVGRCLFVDDLEVNLDGARRAGMHARLFDVRDPAGSMNSILGEFGIAPAPGPDRPGVFRA
jgi:FMN phosphatase YigB (HAD superfamily)